MLADPWAAPTAPATTWVGSCFTGRGARGRRIAGRLDGESRRRTAHRAEDGPSTRGCKQRSYGTRGDRSRDRSRNRNRNRSRDRSRNRSRSRNRNRNRSRNRNRNRNRSRNRNRNRNRNRSRNRSRSRSRSKSRNRSRSRSRNTTGETPVGRTGGTPVPRATRNSLRATGYGLRATGYGLPATGYRLPATGYGLRATSGGYLPVQRWTLRSLPTATTCAPSGENVAENRKSLGPVNACSSTPRETSQTLTVCL